MLVLKIVIAVLAVSLVSLAFCFFKYKMKQMPISNLWGVLVLDEDRCIIRVHKPERIATLDKRVKSINGISIDELKNYVVEQEQNLAIKIAQGVADIGKDGSSSLFLEDVYTFSKGEPIKVECIIEQLPDGRIICSCKRTKIEYQVCKEPFIKDALYLGANSIPIGICIRHYIDGVGKTIFTNDQARDFLSNIDDNLSEWDISKEYEEDDEIAKSGVAIERIRSFMFKNRKTVYFNLNKRRIIGDNNQVYIYVFFVDISKFVDRLHKLESINRNMTLAIDAGQISAWMFDVKTQNTYTLFGTTISDTCTTFRDMLEQVHKDDRNILIDAFNQLISSAKDRLTVYFRYKDPLVGQYRNIESKVIACKSEYGQVTHINGVQRDVTYEFAIKKQTELLDSCLRQSLLKSGVVVWAYNIKRKRNVLLLGETVEIDNFTPEAVLGTVANEYSEKLLKLVNGEIESFSHFYIDVEGNAYEYDASVINSTSGKPEFIIGTRNNVSNIKEEFNRVSSSNAQLLAMLNSLPVGVVLFDANGVLVNFNKPFEDIFGIKNRAHLIEHAVNIQDNPTISDDIKRKAMNGVPINTFISYDFDVVHKTEYYKTSRTGTAIIDMKSSNVYSGDGTLIGIVFTVNEVSESIESDRQNLSVFLHNNVILDSIPVSLELYSKDGTLLYANSFDRNLFSTLQKRVGEYNFRNDNYLSPENVEKILDGTLTQLSVEYYDANSSLYYLNYYITILRDSNNMPDGFLFIITDETPKVAKQATIAKEVENLSHINQFLLDNLQVGLVYIDNDYNIVWQNISEYMPNNVEALKYRTGVVCYRSVKGSSVPCENCILAKSIRTGKAEIGEIQLGGVPIEVHVKPIFVANGKRNGSIIRMIDVSGRKHATEKHSEAKDRADETDRLKNIFWANMSHEIRTPLSLIVGSSNLLENSNDETTIRQCNRIISTNIEILQSLISDFHGLSKIESGVIEHSKTKFNANQLIIDLAMSFEIRAKRGIRICTELPSVQYNVVTDKCRVSQVICNFMTNAVKYTDTGSITLKYEPKDRGILLSVADTGIGISHENLPIIFDRFQKISSNIQGTGLGLSICKAIVESMGGTIGVESEVGVGSTFWAYIPCEVIKDTEATIEFAGAITSRFKKALIVDDNDSNYLLVKLMLEKSFEIQRAKNGEEAVSIARSNPPDFILMDMKMPKMDGVEATIAIREFNSTIPIIVLSSYAFEYDKERAMRAGCNAFLTKPLIRRDLDKVLYGL